MTLKVHPVSRLQFRFLGCPSRVLSPAVQVYSQAEAWGNQSAESILWQTLLSGPSTFFYDFPEIQASKTFHFTVER